MQTKDQEAVREAFAGIEQPVHLLLFTSAESGEYGDVARELLAEVAVLNEQIFLETADLAADAERAASLGVDKTVIDELVHIEGTVPGSVMLEKLGEAMLAELPR